MSKLDTISDLIEEHKVVNWCFSLLLILLALFLNDVDPKYKERLIDGAFLLIPISSLSSKKK